MQDHLTHLEELLKFGNAANFVKTVDAAIGKGDKLVLMTLRAFYKEPELLYTALAYASARGVAVTFAPGAMPEDEEQTSTTVPREVRNE